MLEILSNPRCSKCRQAVAYLESQSVEYRIRLYLQDPLSLDELRALSEKMGLPPQDWMREKVYGTDEERLRAIAERPELLQRPILISGERAVVARTPEAPRGVFSSLAFLGSPGHVGRAAGTPL